jgi:hypothetical protein
MGTRILMLFLVLSLFASCRAPQADLPTPEPATPDPNGPHGETEPIPTDSSEFASDAWRVYRDEKLGYSFHYPADAQVTTEVGQPGVVYITGPLIADENWPQMTISHPNDREDYRPPEDVDLEAWLINHNLLGDERRPDVQIAGTTAIHVRHDRSPQSYAWDRYFFAKSGQLYTILIGHAGDKEDWLIYDHFLRSFHFE